MKLGIATGPCLERGLLLPPVPGPLMRSGNAPARENEKSHSFMRIPFLPTIRLRDRAEAATSSCRAGRLRGYMDSRPIVTHDVYETHEYG